MPDRPVYWLTVIDAKKAVDPDALEPYDDDDPNAEPPQPLPKPTASQLAGHYENLLRGLDFGEDSKMSFVGMVEPAFYVSVHRLWGAKRRIHYHVHALVWGIEEEALKRRCKRLRKEITAALPGATAVQYDPVRKRDLLQVIWYMTKAPRKQYQAASRPSGRAKQWKRDISGANAARLYDAMAHMHLDKLMVAGGRGKKVLKRALQEAEEWAEQRRRASAALRRLRRVRNVSGPVQYELRDPRLWHQLFAEIEPQDILGRG